jgi:4-diphosphocytidyl-2-C-methyl-D-erythritol kinase
MHVRRLATQVEVVTPAKINLFLEVLGKRADGYHELETVLVTVAMYDTLIFQPRNDAEIRLSCRWGAGLSAAVQAMPGDHRNEAEPLFGEIPRDSENLVWRAVERLRTAAQVTLGAAIWLVKRIPAAAGLGGASSDAAAALVAANQAWNLDWPRQRLAEVAAELGSDVPFFLSRGAAICRGRGEQVEPLAVPRLHVIVVRPPSGLSTPRVFAACRPTPRRIGSEAFVADLAGGNLAAVGRRMQNGLQSAAAGLTPWIGRLADEFREQGVSASQMSGSGTSLFALCRTARQARRLASRLRARRMGAVYAAASARGGESIR